MILAIILSTLLWAGVSSQDLQKSFTEPPAELANHVIWGWNGEMAHETMCHDLDSMKLKGFNSVIFEAGYHLPYEYLSEDWFKAIRTAVMEAKARGMNSDGSTATKSSLDTTCCTQFPKASQVKD